jgi:hypothetical protein
MRSPAGAPLTAIRGPLPAPDPRERVAASASSAARRLQVAIIMTLTVFPVALRVSAMWSVACSLYLAFR